MTEQSLFDTCWQALHNGESLDAIFERNPDQRQELESMLLAAGQLQAMRAMATPAAFRQSARTRLLEQMSSAPQKANASYWERLSAWWDEVMTATIRPRPTWAGAALGMVLALLLLTTTSYAVQTTIPGDSLYPLKLVSEDVWLRLAANTPDVHLTLAERRLQEARTLQMENRNEAVPETVSRYRQALENWSERAEMAGLQDQDRVQQRLHEHLQTLQELEQSAPAGQQALLQEQHLATERLMHRFGPPLTP